MVYKIQSKYCHIAHLLPVGFALGGKKMSKPDAQLCIIITQLVQICYKPNTLSL